MSTRWLYKVADVPLKLFAGKLTNRIQAELDRLGGQGWELVSVTHASSADVVRLYLKKAA
jgi:hypothetical protein